MHDLNPTNAFSDFGTDALKAVKNPYVDAGLAGLAAVAAPYLIPEIGTALGGLGTALGIGDAAAAGAGGLGAADAAAAGGFDLATIGPGTAAADAGVTSFLADPVAAAAGGAGTDALAFASPAAATTAAPAAAGGFDLATIGPGTAAATDAAAGAPLNLASAVGTAAGTAAPAANAGGGILSGITSALQPVTSTLKAVSPLIGAAGFGYNLYNGYEQKKALNALNSQEQAKSAAEQQIATTDLNAAQPALATGQQLQQYLTTGTLPQAFQSQIEQQIAAAKASIIQGYASRGMPTNPNANSALAQDLSNVDAQALTLKTNMEQTLAQQGNAMVTQANQLLQSGASATEISARIPVMMARLNQELNDATAKSLSNFAAAMNAGGAFNQKPGTVTFNLAA